MSSRQEILDNIINETQSIVERELCVELSNQIVSEIEELLDKEYLKKSETREEKLHNAECWSGGVWDRLYHYHDEFKPLLVLNYEEMENNGCISPVMTSFPHKELNTLCIENLEKLNDTN